jgi:putative isomerase
MSKVPDDRAEAGLRRLLRAAPQLGARDSRLVRRAFATLEGNQVADPGAPWAPYRAIYPSHSTYPGVWNWDAAFHAMAVARWDIELARDQMRILFGFQLDSGQYPDVIHSSGDVLATIGKPPVLATACAQLDRMDPDDEFANLAYDSLAANLGFWLRERGGERDGLCYYDSSSPDAARRVVEAKWESGWDNSVRWDETITGLWPVDLNCFLILSFREMRHLAHRVGRPEEISRWTSLARSFARAVNERMWSERQGAYADVFRHDSSHSTALSPAAFMPLYAGIAESARTSRLARLAASREHFFPGMPTIAYSHPSYDSADFWRGPTWLNTTYFALLGLHRSGHAAVADTMRTRILDWCDKNDESIFEYYDSRSGQGLGARQFGWSAAFILALILDFT